MGNKKLTVFLVSICLVSMLGGVSLAVSCAKPAATPAPTPIPAPTSAPASTPAPTKPAEVIQWKAFLHVGINSSVELQSLEVPYLKAIEQASQGELKIAIYDAGEHPFKAYADQYVALRDGECQILCGNPWLGAASFTPAAPVDHIPFLFPAGRRDLMLKTNRAVMDKVLMPIYDSKGLGFKILQSGLMPNYHLTGKTPMNSLNAIRGKTFRVSGDCLMKAFEVWGAKPIPVPWGEIYTAAQTGLINGMLLNIPAFEMLKLYEVFEYYTLSDIAACGFATMVRTKDYEALPARLRKIVDQVTEEWKPRFSEDALMPLNDAIMGRMKTDRGVKFETMPSDLRKELQKMCKEGAWPVWAATNSDTKKAWDVIMEELTKAGVAP